MALALKYKKTAKEQINEYLSLCEKKDQTAMLIAIAELRRELGKLATNPRLGTAPTGPFETRPIYKFSLGAGDKRRHAQVSYHVDVSKGEIEILLFSSVPY